MKKLLVVAAFAVVGGLAYYALSSDLACGPEGCAPVELACQEMPCAPQPVDLDCFQQPCASN